MNTSTQSSKSENKVQKTLLLGFLTLVVLTSLFPSPLNAQLVMRLSIDRTSLAAGESATIVPVLVSGTLNSRDFTLTASPSVGTIIRSSPSSFRYTAPASISVSSTVTLSFMVTGLSSPVRGTVQLVAPAPPPPPPPAPSAPTPTLRILPEAVTLEANQGMQFTAQLNGASTTNVQWSIVPAIGAITSSGYYRAPSSIPSKTTVQVLARSTTNSSILSAATIYLLASPAQQSVSVSITPNAVSLHPGQGFTFVANVNGTTNKGVAWSISPQIGSIINGRYTAPSQVAAQTTVTVSATSLADPSRRASASVILIPLVSVSLNVQNLTLQSGSSFQFAATVSGTSNTAVSWSLSPSVGALAGGLYMAPSNLTSPATVTVTATSLADSSKRASANINLTPSSNTSSAITLPVEVYGDPGTSEARTFTLTSSQVSAARRLYLQIHGLDFEGEASVQLNDGPWVELNSTTFSLFRLDRLYGGIGGGFSTLRGHIAINPAWLVTGLNTIRFSFNRTNGITHGFRILALNLVNDASANLLPNTTFQQDDPSQWKAPLADAASIATGKWLWNNANLSTPTAPSIKAKCADCHTQSGRDLKYFNYSNHVIRTRARFHGLTDLEGDQIASYIRSLPVPAPGRPWNPPYQPGPGLDSKPVSEWAAGAGLEAVLDRDRDSLMYIFPNGFENSRIAPTANLSVREIPVALQLPDWNRWLPEVHPKDSMVGFETSKWYQNYLTIRSSLRPGDASSYLSQRENLIYSRLYRDSFIASAVPSGLTQEARVRAIYSAALWQLSKSFELNQEFGLEALSRNWFGPQADPRAWSGADAFFTSPFMLKIPSPSPGVRNGLAVTHGYLGFVWYHLQLILNNSNKTQEGTSPIDWPYSYGTIRNIGKLSPQASILFLWVIKAGQVSENGIGPEVPSKGWNFGVNGIPITFHFDTTPYMYSELSISERNTILGLLWGNWTQKVRTFSPSQVYSGGETNAREVPVGPVYADGNLPSRILNSLYHLNKWGINPTATQELRNWARTVWPAFANW